MKPVAVWVLSLTLLVAPTGEAAAQQIALPDGVTEDMMSTGEQLFRSVGLCFACHAQDGSGTPGAGPDLTSGDWLHITGDFTQIVDLVLLGVPPGKSQSGAFMPPKGGSQLTNEQVRAVASYVWKISHGST